MPQKTKTTAKRKMVRKPKMRAYELDYVLELPANASIDEFVDRLVELVESMGGYIGGGAMPYKAGKNGKEKRHQLAPN